MSIDQRRPEKGNAGGLKKAPGQILREEIREGRATIRRGAGGLFLSGLSAGLDIGFSPFLVAVTMTLGLDTLPRPVAALVLAGMDSVGFIVGRSELFTEQTTLVVMPVLNRTASVTALARPSGSSSRGCSGRSLRP
ncbi:MAG: formate/nitrite transporter [Gemmataceae bacterium]|nr:formate/nitrite transporter [Gemmataceae bacterium]